MEERSNNNNVAVDVSRFFLFESTGDSSEVVNSSPAEDYWAHDDGDDDAQSCSYDDTSSSDVRTVVRVFGDGNEDSEPGPLDCSRSSEDEDEEDGDEVNQSQNKQKESSKQQGGSVELVSEKDGDRLFWEACLAS